MLALCPKCTCSYSITKVVAEPLPHYATEKTMSQRILQNLDTLVTETFEMHDDGEGTFKSLKAKVSLLATQIAVLEKLGPVVGLIRRGEPLPMRALSYNIKKLSEDDSKRDNHGDSRWACLQRLGCETAIFCMISCAGLALWSVEEYGWLLNNAQRYLAVQELPLWATREQIRKVLANVPRRPNIASFLNSKSSGTDLFLPKLTRMRVTMNSRCSGTVQVNGALRGKNRLGNVSVWIVRITPLHSLAQIPDAITLLRIVNFRHN